MYGGDDYDIHGWTAEPPLRDRPGEVFHWRFGSCHSAGCFIATCDGSVHLVAFTIDASVHRYLGNRIDNVVPTSLPWAE